MSRQGLRSSRIDETMDIDTEREELDQTIVEVQEESNPTNNQDLGGQGINKKIAMGGLPTSMAKRLEELEKRVKRMMDEERKRIEKMETERDRNIQKKLTTMEAGINRSLEVTAEVTQALEERSARIESRFNRLEAQQTRILERVHAEDGREEVRGLERNAGIKYVLPEFQGDTSPIRYMNQMKQYWEAVKPRDSDTHYLIEKSLGGPPVDWWQIVKEEVNNLQTFLSRFSRRFWNEQAQHELRRKLEFGSHQGGRMGSRAEYAIRLYAEARELQPIMSPGEIIQKLARHYNEEIKYAIVGRGISHIHSLVELLENFDRIGPINIGKDETRERRIQGEIYNNRRENQPQEQLSWSSQQRGNWPEKTEHSRPQNVPTWQKSSQGNYGSRGERNIAQSAGGPWKNNPPAKYLIRNIEVDETRSREEIEEEVTPDTKSGNELQPRL